MDETNTSTVRPAAITEHLTPVPLTLAPGPEYQTAQRGFQGIPGLAVAPGGRLWATWYTGGVTEGPDNYVVLVTSGDHGETWTEPVAVVAPPGKVRAFDPALWLDPTGRLWWFWAQSYSSKDLHLMDCGQGGVWGVFTTEPDSAQPRFSVPQRCANGVMMNKPVVLANGEWALPTAIWNHMQFKGTTFAAERFSNIVISADEGRTFAPRGGADVPERCHDEHMIVELRDGRLWMLVRTHYGIGQSFSSDGGRTWSPGEDSGLGGPNSRFFIHRLASGNLLLVNHADLPAAQARELWQAGQNWRPRSHLTARLSMDDGRTWQGGLVLDERQGVSYPDGAQGVDGTIYLIYDHERNKLGDICLAKFREEDVLAGSCRSADARLKLLINRTGVVRPN